MNEPHFFTKVTCYGRAPSKSSKNGSDISAMLSYRTGYNLTSLHDGLVKYPRGSKDRIASNAIFGMGDSTTPSPDRVQAFCNLIDESEKRKNSRICREVLVSIPRGLSNREQQKLIKDICLDLTSKYNTCAVASIHLDGKDENPHAHIILPTRQYDREAGKFTQKIRILDDKKQGPIEMKSMRDSIIDRVNLAKDLSLTCPSQEKRSDCSTATLPSKTKH